MATSIFDEKAIIPNDSMVDMVLADKKELWDTLKSLIIENYQNVSQDWKYYSKKSGWSLIFKQNKRTLFYFIPCNEYFRIAFVFGEKATKAAEQSLIPVHIKETISAAPAYAEGRSFFVDVQDEKDLDPVLTLLKIKYES